MALIHWWPLNGDLTDKIGFLTEERSLLTKLTVYEQIIYYGVLKSMDEEDIDKELKEAKETIKNYFNTGKVVTTDSGSVVAIFYANTFGELPTGDAELEKIEINLTIKEWSVN